MTDASPDQPTARRITVTEPQDVPQSIALAYPFQIALHQTDNGRATWLLTRGRGHHAPRQPQRTAGRFR